MTLTPRSTWCRICEYARNPHLNPIAQKEHSVKSPRYCRRDAGSSNSGGGAFAFAEPGLFGGCWKGVSLFDHSGLPRDQSSWSPLLLEGLPLKRGLKPTATHIKTAGRVGVLSLSHPLAERVMQCRAKRKLASLAKCARDASSQTTVQSLCR
jgi:hypothetical protein